MKYEVFDIEITGVATQRIVNVKINDTSAVNFPADNTNDSYLEFLTSQGISDKDVQKLATGKWFDFVTPAPAGEVVNPVVTE
jgi:hypothetical protein